MAKKYKIVVDANIARSSGTTENPVSKSCRAVLDNILKNDHSFVACKTLLIEWRKHQSFYSMKWLASMYARKRVEIVAHEDRSKVTINSSIADSRFKVAALKDSHIIDAASLVGKFVTSSDDRAREAFSAIPELVSINKKIVWINPTTKGGDLVGILGCTEALKPEHKIV